MKSGETGYLKISIANLKINVVSKIIFTLKKTGGEAISKEYPSDVTFDGTNFLIPLTQDDTEALNGYYQIEAQINFTDKSVSKSDCQRKYMADTLATEEVEGNTPSTQQTNEIALTIAEVQIVNQGGSGTSNYNDLSNKPSINGVTLAGNKTAEDLGITSGDLTVKTLIDTLSANRKRDFAFRDMPKAQFVLILDDCLPSVISTCVTNANAKNIPLCMSAISEYFNDLCTKGNTSKTVLEEIKRGIQNGGEVLLHGNGTINATNIDDEDVLQSKFLDEKEVFIDNGLNPRGVIVIGGGNEIYGDARTDRWVRALFDYSDGYGIGEPYYHRRNAPTTLDAAKTIIDTAIANKTFCPIFAHKWYDFWNEMIDYAIAQGGEWVTYSTVYDTYGTTKSVKAMETRIKALEQGGGGTPTLSSITATKTTTSYTVGDTLSTSDITVTAHYSDETTEVVTSSATIDASGVNMSASGTYSISITYEDKSTSISITVADAPSPSGTIIYQVDSVSGTCNGTADAKVGSSSTSWTSGKQYKYEFDYEVTAVADDSTTVSIRDVNGGDLGVTITNATVGAIGSVNRTVNNSSTRTRQAFLLKNVNNKSYSVKLTNVKITEL